jgi:lipopolysaccharide biosynthesis glycosyltransferase
MKNLLLTLNINDVLCENSKRSFLNAKNRWGCNFEEITENYFPEYYPSFNKFKIFELFQNYDRILFVDADILIHNSSPNPFELYFGDFCAVHDVHYDNIEHVLNNNVFLDYLTPYYDIIKSKIDNNINSNFIKNFFNSGVMLFTPSKLKTIFQKYKNIIPNTNGGEKLHLISHYEQSLLNYIVQKNIDIEYMESSWNVINPNLNKNMHGFIYHFTGTNNNLLKIKIKNYSWE